MSCKTKIILEKLDQIKVNLGKFMVEGGVDIGSHMALRQLIEEAERLVDFAELDKWETAPSASTNSKSMPCKDCKYAVIKEDIVRIRNDEI